MSVVIDPQQGNIIIILAIIWVVLWAVFQIYYMVADTQCEHTEELDHLKDLREDILSITLKHAGYKDAPLDPAPDPK